jgi:hypothetical protein
VTIEGRKIFVEAASYMGKTADSLAFGIRVGVGNRARNN